MILWIDTVSGLDWNDVGSLSSLSPSLAALGTRLFSSSSSFLVSSLLLSLVEGDVDGLPVVELLGEILIGIKDGLVKLAESSLQESSESSDGLELILSGGGGEVVLRLPGVEESGGVVEELLVSVSLDLSLSADGAFNGGSEFEVSDVVSESGLSGLELSELFSLVLSELVVELDVGVLGFLSLVDELLDVIVESVQEFNYSLDGSLVSEEILVGGHLGEGGNGTSVVLGSLESDGMREHLLGDRSELDELLRSTGELVDDLETLSDGVLSVSGSLESVEVVLVLRVSGGLNESGSLDVGGLRVEVDLEVSSGLSEGGGELVEVLSGSVVGVSGITDLVVSESDLVVTSDLNASPERVVLSLLVVDVSLEVIEDVPDVMDGSTSLDLIHDLGECHLGHSKAESRGNLDVSHGANNEQANKESLGSHFL